MLSNLLPAIKLLETEQIKQEVNNVKIYRESYTVFEKIKLLMVKDHKGKWLLVLGEGALYDELNGELIHQQGKACPLTHENRLVLNRYFDYTVPKAFGKDIATIGLGDRLGLASPGHIETVKGRNVKPILAQQSIRELTLTNRSMKDILDAASFAVFQEGYKGGFGADGDHLKEEFDIQEALSIGMSMLTLDCSDYIKNHVSSLNLVEMRHEYSSLSQEIKSYYSKYYMNKTFSLNGITITYNEEEVMKNALIYRDAINYMEHVYKKYISIEDRAIDFEISIDETKTITTPAEHFFVANELNLKGVKITSLAPRFCGEFQKGIDYIGDIYQLERELKEHAVISNHFKYKLSIHSGSDKFKVFPIISKCTEGIFHLKTAGTNWLEAISVISKVNPSLYRKMHTFVINNYKEAQKYYHVTPDIATVLHLENVPDEELKCFMNNNAARQLFHITYGLLLEAKDNVGQYLFKTELFNTLNEYEDEYRESLVLHIGQHLDLLEK